jgi:hypothetical protein
MDLSPIWTQLKILSAQDTKTVSGCVLKVFEEGGELSGAAQPFDGLDGSHHRLASRRDVLEECVDGILANLSIVCKLGFDQADFDDMMSQKMAKWATKQRSQAVMQQSIPYEIHVTVTHADLDAFRKACVQLNVKPIILDLQNAQQVVQDVMTSSVVMGNNNTARIEMERISEGLTAAGFTVVREKIETVPWHPAAPSEEYGQSEMPKDCYFESHIAVLITDDAVKSHVQSLCAERNLHLSRNAMKRYENGSYRQMITYRAYTGTREHFLQVLQSHVDALRLIQTTEGPLDIDKVITEFSLFDSRVHHDRSWLQAPLPSVHSQQSLPNM